MFVIPAQIIRRTMVAGAHSALPDAPVVDDVRAPSRSRIALAAVLYRTAGALDPAQGRPRRGVVRQLGVTAR